MIQPNELTQKISGNKLLILFKDTNTVLAEIDKDRNVAISNSYSFELKTVDKIHHIAKYYDEVQYFPVKEDESEDFSITSFNRFMNNRPEILKSDLCKLFNVIEFPITDKIYTYNFRIASIFTNQTNLLLDCVDSKEYKQIKLESIDNIILQKKYYENMYYIQNGYVGNAIQWWALGSSGYTTDINKAHKFNIDEVNSILKNNINDHRRNERAWPVDYIDQNEKAKKIVIDMQYLDSELEYKIENS